jgi:hypothetical protein
MATTNNEISFLFITNAISSDSDDDEPPSTADAFVAALVGVNDEGDTDEEGDADDGTAEGRKVGVLDEGELDDGLADGADEEGRTDDGDIEEGRTEDGADEDGDTEDGANVGLNNNVVL